MADAVPPERPDIVATARSDDVDPERALADPLAGIHRGLPRLAVPAVELLAGCVGEIGRDRDDRVELSAGAMGEPQSRRGGPVDHPIVVAERAWVLAADDPDVRGARSRDLPEG